MKAMLDTSEDLDVCEREIGCECEQLLTPLTRFKKRQARRGFLWGGQRVLQEIR